MLCWNMSRNLCGRKYTNCHRCRSEQKNDKKKHNICESDNFMHTCESVHKENFNPSKHVLPPNAERMSLFRNECGQPIKKN